MSLTPDLAASLAAGDGLLVPDRAGAAALRLAFAAEQRRQGLKVWASPRVLTLAAFLRECAAEEGQPLLSQALEWGLLRQFARSLASDAEFSELANAGQANALADSWQRSLTLLRDYDIAPGSLQALATPESRLLLRARAMLVQCSAESYGAMAPSTYWPRHPPANSRWRHAGFAPLPRAWRSLLKTSADDSPVAQPPNPALTKRHLAADPSQELALAMAWARSKLDRGQKALLVVPPGKDYEPALQRGLQSLARLDAGRDGAVLLDRRRTLAESAWVREVTFAIAWLCEAHSRDDILAGLQSGGSDIAERTHRAQLATWYRQGSMPPQGIGAALAMLDRDRGKDWAAVKAWLQGLESCRSLLGDARERRSDWPERFAALSAALPFDLAGDGALDARSLQQAWQELLQEIAQLGEITGPVSARTALGLLTARAARTRLPDVAADSRIHVLRSRRDPLIQYDAIWVCGLAASQWPDAVVPDAWVPRSLLTAAGVEAADAPGRLHDAEQQLAAWRRAGTDLRLSQPAQLDEARTSVSPLLRDVAVAENSDLMASAIALSWNERIVAATPAPKVFVDESFSTRIQGAVKGGVSLLDHYNDCPFRGATEHRFNLMPEQELTPGLDALESGRQLHELLQAVWTDLGGSDGLAARSETQCRELIGRHADAVLAKAHERSDARQVAYEVQQGLLRHRVEKLLALERRRSPFRVRGRELKLRLELAGADFEVRIDRLDELLDESRLGSGQHLVIDYKSGASGKPNWEHQRLRNIQLLLYRSALLDQGMASCGLLTWHLGADGVTAGGATATKNLLPKDLQPRFTPIDWEKSARDWRERLQQLADGLWAGRATLEPAENACQHCPLPVLCRRDARLGSKATGDNDAGE